MNNNVRMEVTCECGAQFIHYFTEAMAYKWECHYCGHSHEIKNQGTDHWRSHNPWSHDHYNLTNQINISRVNPQLADELIAAVGADDRINPQLSLNLDNGAKIEFGGYDCFKYHGADEFRPTGKCDWTTIQGEITAFDKLVDRVGEEIWQCEDDEWQVHVPDNLAKSLTPDTAPELERRLTLALRILKEGK
jgi:hypothetical protein